MQSAHTTSLEGRSVLVTGASSGIGSAIAVELAGRGASVALVGRSESRLRDSAERVEAAGGQAAIVTADVSDPGEAGAIVDRAASALGGLDHIVHAAGIYDALAFEETSVDSFDRQIATNVRGPFFVTQRALEHLHQGSAIVFTASIFGRSGAVMASAYAASKAALDGLTVALAIELAPRGIRVNAVVPGCIETPMNVGLREDAELTAQLAAGAACNRWGKAEEVAPAVAFLLSDDASFIYGSSLVVDGGWLAK